MAQRGVQTNLSQPTEHTFSFVHAEIQYAIYPHNVFCILCGMVETKRKEKNNQVERKKRKRTGRIYAIRSGRKMLLYIVLELSF